MQTLKPGFHIMGSRVETRRFQPPLLSPCLLREREREKEREREGGRERGGGGERKGEGEGEGEKGEDGEEATGQLDSNWLQLAPPPRRMRTNRTPQNNTRLGPSSSARIAPRPSRRRRHKLHTRKTQRLDNKPGDVSSHFSGSRVRAGTAGAAVGLIPSAGRAEAAWWGCTR
jgi:hypothetical protein